MTRIFGSKPQLTTTYHNFRENPQHLTFSSVSHVMVFECGVYLRSEVLVREQFTYIILSHEKHQKSVNFSITVLFNLMF